MQLFHKMPSGMANSVDPDQTAPEAVWSGSTLFAYAILSDTLEYEIVQHLQYIVSTWKKCLGEVLLMSNLANVFGEK